MGCLIGRGAEAIAVLVGAARTPIVTRKESKAGKRGFPVFFSIVFLQRNEEGIFSCGASWFYRCEDRKVTAIWAEGNRETGAIVQKFPIRGKGFPCPIRARLHQESETECGGCANAGLFRRGGIGCRRW